MVPGIGPVLCSPTKEVFQYQHDKLNALGLPVKIKENIPVIRISQVQATRAGQNLDDISKTRWVAFGDKGT